MHDDIDDALRRLAMAPVHPGLGDADAQILVRIAAAAPVTSNGTSLKLGAFAALAAVAMGIAGASLPTETADAAPLSPFGVESPLLPSSLLAGA